MAKPRSRDSGRFRIYVSDRSGLEFGFQPITSYPNAYGRESGKPVQDNNVKVSPNEFDQPPPSKQPLGGEGDVSNGNVRANSNFDTSSNAFLVDSANVVIVNSSNSIAFNQDPWTKIAGNITALTMAVNPQVVAGAQSQKICFMCVSNQITLLNGSGLVLQSSQFQMNSGSIICLVYQTSNLAWQETSRSAVYADLGRF